MKTYGWELRDVQEVVRFSPNRRYLSLKGSLHEARVSPRSPLSDDDYDELEWQIENHPLNEDSDQGHRKAR
ncbi:hypothetical protein CORC01_10803 [Colletotrichum orchidophilum]|uniref:Uncharacterized protein n=1 Tax=Colletotrichum orchidophilum TaxID=1209926 RepID=A0A1G4AXN2_9PEZI|nr:uncharacterized protein CORC01_10803 [Colletotrichum orchidophilum]OHE93904.1 hypothetical protein CORC01_10803 [Colletotrichum orchidophilum]